MENKEKRKTMTSKKNLFSYFNRVQKHDSSRERNEIEDEDGQVDIFYSSRHKVVDMSTTYVQENCIENEVNLTYSDVEGLVDLTKEYEELRRPNKRRRGIWDSGRSFQLQWTSIFPFMEPVTCENGDVIEVKCVICS